MNFKLSRMDGSMEILRFSPTLMGKSAIVCTVKVTNKKETQ